MRSTSPLLLHQRSINSIAHPTRPLTPTDLLDRRLATLARNIDVRATTRIDLSAHDLDNPKLVALLHAHDVPIGNQARESLALKITLIPEVNLNGHVGGHELVHLGLDGLLPPAIDAPAELTRGLAGEVRGLQLVEARDLRLEQAADGGAEDVAGRVQARVQVARVAVNALLDGRADLERRAGRAEVAEVEDEARRDGVHAGGGDGEGRVGAGAGYYPDVRGLAAALRVEDCLLRDDDVVCVGAVLEQRPVGFGEGREVEGGLDGGLQLVQVSVVVEGQVGSCWRRLGCVSLCLRTSLLLPGGA